MTDGEAETRADATDHPPRTDWRELVAVLLLSVTTILTAWTVFQSTKWHGEESVSFTQASAARIEASRQEGVANRRDAIQVTLYTQWLQASANDDTRLATYLVDRFPEPLKAAFAAWQATDPDTNPDAPSSPFVMPEYAVPELTAAKAADARADEKFAAALSEKKRGDNYTLLTVLFASVLFFAAMSGRVRSSRSQWVLLGVGLVLFGVALALLVAYPKLV